MRQVQFPDKQQLHEQEKIKMQQLNKSTQMSKLLSEDDNSQLNQEQQRAITRIKERKARAVYLLAVNLCYSNLDPNKGGEFDLNAASMEIDLDEPYNIFYVGFSFHWWQGLVCSPAPQGMSLQ